jgi:polyhydroxybutyrate depolymerase
MRLQRSWSIIPSMTRHQLLLAAAVTALLAGACTGSASPSAEPSPGASASSAAPSTTPSLMPTSSAGSAAGLVVGGDRPVTVHVPRSYPEGQPAPLLIFLHGYGGTGAQGDDYFGLGTRAKHDGFVYAAPDGTLDSVGNRFWNATEACCDFDSRGVDDVAYLTSVIADIQGELAIDPARIALVGWSNGAFMSYRLACERADLIAAVVGLAGATSVDPGDCAPSEPVSVAHIHGTADDTVAFDGGTVFDDPDRPYPGAEATVKAWATHDGCDATVTALDARLDLDATLTDDGDRAETSVEEWSGCDAGATVQLWTIPNGAHDPSITSAFAASVIRFLADHPKAGPAAYALRGVSTQGLAGQAPGLR